MKSVLTGTVSRFARQGNKAFRTLLLLSSLFITDHSWVNAAEPTSNTLNFMNAKWRLDTRCVIPRGPAGSWDCNVAGDPCIVWDEDLKTWRMFYFAGGNNDEGKQGARCGIALSKSAEEIGPGDWEKQGPPKLTNPEALLSQKNWEKWWVVMDARYLNRAAKIKNKYWALFISNKRLDDNRSHKHFQAAHAETLAGPWTIVPQPIVAPDEHMLDGSHCDAPTAFWFPEEDAIYIFYMAYPRHPQTEQEKSQFGSGTMLAKWHPDNPTAEKIKVLMRPGQSEAWNQGWMASPQLFFDAEQQRWYGLINGSPTSPKEKGSREPAPSLGGWVVCSGKNITDDWQVDTAHSPLLHPDQLSEEQLAAGLGTNFWRHHLLVTPGGQARIFFNSGAYGKEQMYSWIRE